MNVRVALRLLCLASLVIFARSAAVSAQTVTAGFPERPALKLTTPGFSDRQIASLIATLDTLIASSTGPADTRSALWNFVRQLQGGRLTARQEARVLDHLDTVALGRPIDAPVVAAARQMTSTLTVGKTAPEIVGRDLSGAEMRLSSFRGKVVVLLFSAEWCGICRTMNPYERLMLELYRNWPFAIVSVETGSSPDAIRRTKAEAGLSYSSWWDGPADEGDGPIASAWNVGGFPTIYVLDERGVIRFVDLRYEDLLKGVRQLLTEQAELRDKAARTGT